MYLLRRVSELLERVKREPIGATLVSLAGDSAVYLVGAAVVGMGNFVLLPLYTRRLTASDFGVYALIEIALLITVTVSQLGLGVSYVRWYAETEPSRRGEVLGSCMFAGFIAGTLGGAILTVGMAGPFSAKWVGSALGASWVFFPLVLVRTAQGILFSALQAAQRPAAYISAASTRLFSLVGAGIWFVAVHGEGIRGVLYSWLVGDGTCFLILMWFCLRGTPLRVRRGLLLPMLKYGVPLVWGSLMALLLDASGRYFLAHYQSLEEVGLYAVGIKIANILSMGFLQPFASAWAGIVFPISHRPNAPITYTKILGYALVVAMLLVAVMITSGRFLVTLLAGRSYAGAYRLLPWLLLPVALRVLEYWSCVPIYLKYKTQWIGPLATVGTALCVVLNWFLVPRLGALGASIAWSAAVAAIIVLTAVIGRKYYPLPLDLRTFGFAASLWAVAVLASRLTATLDSLSAILTSVGLSLLFLLAGVLYFYFDLRESKPLFTGGVYAD